MTAGTARGAWPWFGPWALVGGGALLGILAAMSIGIFLLPAALGLMVLVGTASKGRGWPGLVSGSGLPLLYVAWLNRAGPGSVCHAIRNGTECTQQYSPWPWLGVGLALVGVGLLLAARGYGRG